MINSKIGTEIEPALPYIGTNGKEYFIITEINDILSCTGIRLTNTPAVLIGSSASLDRRSIVPIQTPVTITFSNL